LRAALLQIVPESCIDQILRAISNHQPDIRNRVLRENRLLIQPAPNSVRLAVPAQQAQEQSTSTPSYQPFPLGGDLYRSDRTSPLPVGIDNEYLQPQYDGQDSGFQSKSSRNDYENNSMSLDSIDYEDSNSMSLWSGQNGHVFSETPPTTLMADSNTRNFADARGGFDTPLAAPSTASNVLGMQDTNDDFTALGSPTSLTMGGDFEFTSGENHENQESSVD
jgi:hypothetical protein